MKLRLEAGEVRVRVQHSQAMRWTTADLFGPGGNLYFAEALCHPKDRFVKRVGRRIAANKLLEMMRSYGFSKRDRQRVFDAICPEYRVRPAYEARMKAIMAAGCTCDILLFKNGMTCRYCWATGIKTWQTAWKELTPHG